MKLISYNIGIKLDNSQEVGEFIKSQNPDIVAFQEITRHLDDSVFSQYRSFSDIKKVTKDELPHSFFGPQWITDAMRKSGEIHRDFNGLVEQGNEVASRYPIIEATNEHYYKKYSFELEWVNFHDEDHPRALQIVEIDIQGKPLQILNLHGSYSRDKQDSERTIQQSQYVLDAAKRKSIPTIIVGDFNLFPETESIKMIDKEYRNLIKENNIRSTRPDFDDGTDKGNNVVDYIFISNDIQVNNFDVIQTNISDHLPLMLDFELG